MDSKFFMLNTIRVYKEICGIQICFSSSNEMATAAMRFGHSLINGVFTLVKDNGVSDRSNNLTELFFDSDIIYRDGKMSG